MSNSVERAKQEVIELANTLYGGNDIALKMVMNGYMNNPDVDKLEYWEMIRTGLSAAAGVMGKTPDTGSDAGSSNNSASDFHYEEDGGSITIIKYKGNKSKEVTIPGEINGKPVTKIGKQAFEFTDVTDLIISDSVTTIDDEACSYGKLINVTIGNGVKTIGKQAFKSNKIEKLILGSSVVTIDEEAFTHNVIKSLTLPESIKEIGKDAFLHDNEFKEVIIPDGDVFIGKDAFNRGVIVTTVSGTVIDLKKKSKTPAVQPQPQPQPEAPKNFFCTECGNKLSVEAKFCTNCGKAVVTPKAAAQPKPTAPSKYVCITCGYVPSDNNWFCNKCGTPTVLPVPVIGADLDASKMADRYKIEEIQNLIPKYEAEKLKAEEQAKTYFLIKEHKDGSWLYKLNGDTVVITGYDGTSSDIQIPLEIQGKSVTEIGERAFHKKGITSVNIPSGIKAIGESAFSGNKLTVINIPGSVETVGEFAFMNNELTSIILGEGIKEIRGNAFEKSTRFGEEVSKIANVVIPGSIKDIGKEAFFRSRIGSITISSGVQSIGEKAFLGNQFKEVVIPEGVTEIGEKAFQENFITSLSLPNSLKKIGDEAFCVGNKLPSLTLPPNLTALGEEAFAGNKLTEITIPASLKRIGSEAFAGNEIERITIQEGVTTIGAGAFKKNNITDNKFVSTLLPASVTVIEEEAFVSNKLTGDIVIPQTIKKIGKGAFEYNQLTGVEARGETEIGTDAFKSNKIVKVIIGSRVPSIKVGAFTSNSNLVGVTLPESVQIPECYPKLPDASFNLDTYIERGNTDNLRFDDTSYWQNFENKIKINKAAAMPREPITIHDAKGQQVGIVQFTDILSYNDKGGRYRGMSKANAKFYDSKGKHLGFFSIGSPLYDTIVPDNYALGGGGGVVTIDGIVIHGAGEMREEFFSETTGKIKTSMVNEVEKYRVGNVKAEGNTGVAYNRDGVKLGEVRNGGEFAAVFAAAILIWFA